MECNRFYYRPKTATNYAAFHYHGQTQPVILAFSSNLIYKDGVIFFNGNARANYSRWCKSARGALSFLWECIFHEDPYYLDTIENLTLTTKYQISPEDLKRYEQAEFLHPGPLSVEKIDKVYFRNQQDLLLAYKELGHDERFEVKPEYFF